MKLTHPLRHIGFGNLGVYVRGLVTYKLSPYELKAFDNPSKRLARTLQRCMEEAFYTVPFAAFGWWIHGKVEKKYIEMNRKDPNAYADDK